MAEPARSLPCEYFFPDGGIPTGERIDKLLLSQVLENEKKYPENGSNFNSLSSFAIPY